MTIQKNIEYAYSVLSEREKCELEIYHSLNDTDNYFKLQHLYGKVAALQDKTIIESIAGSTVLDVGSGYGSFAKRLREAGFTVVAIDPHAKSREIAKLWNGINVIPADIYFAPFKNDSFDTVVLREVVEHLDFEKVVTELYRIAKKEVIIFQTNPTLFLQIMRKIIKHKEFNPRSRAYYIDTLERFGFRVKNIKFCDIFALPLSGGLLTRQWCPPYHCVENIIVNIDSFLCKALRSLGLSKYVCWRFCITARVTKNGQYS